MTVLYLDLDGALLPLSEPRGWQESTWKTVNSGFIITYSQSLVDRILELPVEEIVLCSTWGKQANTLMGKIGMGEYRNILESGGEQTKLHAVAEDAARHGKPFIWVDDKSATPSARKKLLQAAEINPHMLLVKPSGAVGVQPSDIDAMQNFLENSL